MNLILSFQVVNEIPTSYPISVFWQEKELSDFPSTETPLIIHQVLLSLLPSGEGHYWNFFSFRLQKGLKYVEPLIAEVPTSQ